MPPARILLSVGDDSGDLHAANLMRAMQDLEPGLEFIGFGMERMVRAGLEPLDAAQDSVMWFGNLLRVGRFRRRLAMCRAAFARGEVDLFVPVDFGGFNLYVCRAAARAGVPVFYYIPPQVWAHGLYRLKKLRKWTDRVGLIYPFEADLYATHGVAAEYVGHPLFDAIERDPPSEEVVAGLRERFGGDLVGIFPGSRRHEVRAHVPLIAECRRRVQREAEGARFAMVCPPGLRAEVGELVGAAGADVAVLEDVRPVELARAARVCLTKSGTITLEIASQRTPMVIFYRTSPFFYFLAKGLTSTPHIGLINVLADREICPERAMPRPDAGWLATQVLRLLRDGEAREACRRDIEEALDGFAEPGASERAARSALALIPTA